MARSSLITVCLLTVVAVVATSDGFFWYGSSGKTGSERSQQQLVPQYQNFRVEQPWPQFYDAAVPPMTVAVPLAVPVPAPVAPVSSGPIKGQPVQLVPCLCPISRDDQQMQSQQGYVIGAAQSQQPPPSS